MKYLAVNSTDNSEFNLNCYPSKKENTVANILISHGLAEHSARYQAFAEFLSISGFQVFTYDHRGHGKRITDKNSQGVFADNNGWKIVVSDLACALKTINRKYPNLKINLIGHSMGALIGLAGLQNTNKVNKFVMSGSFLQPPIIQMLQSLVLKIESMRLGNMGYSNVMNFLVFGLFNKAIKNSQTPNDWLSCNQDSVNDYFKDPNCGFIVSNSIWNDLLLGSKYTFMPKNLSKLDSHLDIVLMSGHEDVVGNFGNGPKRILKLLHQNNINAQLKLYKSMRHEIFNEIDNQVVYDEIMSFLRDE